MTGVSAYCDKCKEEFYFNDIRAKHIFLWLFQGKLKDGALCTKCRKEVQ